MAKTKMDDEGEIIWEAVPGKEGLIKCTYTDENGSKHSTILETFSDEQFEKIDRLRELAKSVVLVDE